MTLNTAVESLIARAPQFGSRRRMSSGTTPARARTPQFLFVVPPWGRSATCRVLVVNLIAGDLTARRREAIQSRAPGVFRAPVLRRLGRCWDQRRLRQTRIRFL